MNADRHFVERSKARDAAMAAVHAFAKAQNWHPSHVVDMCAKVGRAIEDVTPVPSDADPDENVGILLGRVEDLKTQLAGLKREVARMRGRT